MAFGDAFPIPTINDNIDKYLLQDMRATRSESTHADICVGYFNLLSERCISIAFEDDDEER